MTASSAAMSADDGAEPVPRGHRGPPVLAPGRTRAECAAGAGCTAVGGGEPVPVTIPTRNDNATTIVAPATNTAFIRRASGFPVVSVGRSAQVVMVFRLVA